MLFLSGIWIVVCPLGEPMPDGSYVAPVSFGDLIVDSCLLKVTAAALLFIFMIPARLWPAASDNSGGGCNLEIELSCKTCFYCTTCSDWSRFELMACAMSYIELFLW